MKIVYVEEPFFHIIVEETFSGLDSIFNEVDVVKGELKDPRHTGGALSVTGENRKKNKGLFLNERKEYQYLKLVSGINEVLQRLKRSIVWKNQTLYRLYEKTIWTGFLLNHYEHDDYYLPHTDDGLFTFITFLFDDYDNRVGGDLYFPEYDYLHKCKNNQSILFLSSEVHGVTTFESKNNRYSISTFSTLWRRFQDPPLNNKNIDPLKITYN